MIFSNPIDPGPRHPDAGKLLADTGDIVGYDGLPISAGQIYVRRDVAAQAESSGWQIVRILYDEPQEDGSKPLVVVERR